MHAHKVRQHRTLVGTHHKYTQRGLVRAQELIRPTVLLQYLYAFIKEYAELFTIAL